MPNRSFGRWLTDEQWTLFLNHHELNIAYSLSKMGRFRVNVYLQQGTVASVIRQIRMNIPDLETLRLPSLLGDLILAPRGLLLVTGATGYRQIDHHGSHD